MEISSEEDFYDYMLSVHLSDILSQKSAKD